MGKVMFHDCSAPLALVTSRCAAVESGPELSRGGGGRGLLSRGQQVEDLVVSPPLPPTSPLPACVSPLPPAHQPFLEGLSFLIFAREGGGWLLEMRGLLLPPGGALVPVLFDLLV